ncbi:MAG: Gfo/Idh/MocA family oxidoreductase, partial [Acidobacteriota bacterium]|nr:Gfo/Idh/MocA family oxidoreductase [Acidobacteriota bacterium]
MNVAVLGLGFMGSTHLKAWGSVAGARVAGVMSSDATKLSGDLTSISGNLGTQGERFDFSSVRKYRTVGEALADPSVDVADVCLPTGLHGTVALDALRAGKHVFVEKPIALNGTAADAVLKAADVSGRILMAGQVLRFVPAYRAAADWMKHAGPVFSAVFRRRCAAPAWSKWLSDKSQSGGGAFDLLIHDADFCISLWGMPETVRASGVESLAAGVDIVHAELRYPNMGPVIVTGGWHHP